MYTIDVRKGEVVFKDGDIQMVSIEKSGVFFTSYTLIVITGKASFTISNLKKDVATEHFNILNDMIADQEGI